MYKEDDRRVLFWHPCRVRRIFCTIEMCYPFRSKARTARQLLWCAPRESVELPTSSPDLCCVHPDKGSWNPSINRYLCKIPRLLTKSVISVASEPHNFDENENCRSLCLIQKQRMTIFPKFEAQKFHVNKKNQWLLKKTHESIPLNHALQRFNHWTVVKFF